jgi:hypothetical protein
MANFVQVTGNRAVISPAVTRREGALGGFVLHGATGCETVAASVLDLVDSYRQHTEKTSAPFVQVGKDPRISVVQTTLNLTILSSTPDRVGLSMQLLGIPCWLNFVEELLLAATMIRENEKAMKVPVYSDWKQTPGSPMLDVDDVEQLLEGG